MTEFSMTFSTLDQLIHLAGKQLGVPDADVDVDAGFTDLGLDSLMLVDFMFQVEDAFDIRIDHDRALEHPTLAGLAGLVDDLIAQRQPAAA